MVVSLNSRLESDKEEEKVSDPHKLLVLEAKSLEVQPLFRQLTNR